MKIDCPKRLFSRPNFTPEVRFFAADIAATAPIASRLTTLALRGSGHADIEAALANGFADYVTKPFTLERLAGLLARYR